MSTEANQVDEALSSLPSTASNADVGSVIQWFGRRAILTALARRSVNGGGGAGPVGPQGPQGEPGPQGPEGAVGPQGPQGDEGPAGPQGAQGAQGATGETGPQGTQGPAGSAGPQGNAGPQGPAGPQGDIGPTGPAGADGNDGAQGPQGIQGVQGETGSQGAQGPQGNQGPQGIQGDPGPQGIQGIQGPAGQASISVDLLSPNDAASAAATNLAANTFSAPGDPSYRRMLDLRGKSFVRVQGRIGGALVAATRLRVQYHTGGNPAVATGDGGWTTLADTAGSHAVNTMFYSAEISVPAGAQVNNCLIRVGLFGGDGAADPTITCCVLNFYA